MVEVWNYIRDFMVGMSQFWNWLISPIEELGGWRPISIVGIGGITVILAFWIFKLINPLS